MLNEHVAFLRLGMRLAQIGVQRAAGLARQREHSTPACLPCV